VVLADRGDFDNVPCYETGIRAPRADYMPIDIEGVKRSVGLYNEWINIFSLKFFQPKLFLMLVSSDSDIVWILLRRCLDPMID